MGIGIIIEPSLIVNRQILEVLHTKMSIPYEYYGRINQKQRTRIALVNAAAALIESGATPTMAEIAEEAGVAKSTAYRYFPSQDALVAEVLLNKSVSQDAAAIDAVAKSPGTGEARLDAVIRADHNLVIQHEHAFRTALRVMIAPTTDDDGEEIVPHRPGNRLRYLSEALAPLEDQMTAAQMERLVMTLTMCVGMESILALKDICGLSADEAVEVKCWAASALLRATLQENADNA